MSRILIADLCPQGVQFVRRSPRSRTARLARKGVAASNRRAIMQESAPRLEITPDPLGDRNDGSNDVLQNVSWSNFPVEYGRYPKFRYPQNVGGKGLPIMSGPSVYVCQGGGGSVGQCNNGQFPTEGSVDVHYRPSEVHDNYVYSDTYSEVLQFWLDDGGPRFTGTVTVKPISDLILDVATPDENTITMTVHNHGPSHARRSVLKISGFAQALTLSGAAACSSSADKTITCNVDPIRASTESGATCTPGSLSLPTCDQFTLTMAPGWTRTRLTVTVTALASPDPDTSSNTAVAFPGAPLAGDVTPSPGPIVVVPATTTQTNPPRSSSATTGPSSSADPSASGAAPGTASASAAPSVAGGGGTSAGPAAMARPGGYPDGRSIGVGRAVLLTAVGVVGLAGVVIAVILVVRRSRRGRPGGSVAGSPPRP